MSIQRRELLGVLTAGGLAGCTSLRPNSGQASANGENQITLATTTSADDTGIIDALNAPFEERHGVGVHTVALGTGAALETGRAGDADVVLVHAPSLEEEFVREGYGVNRQDLMFNDFAIVGPPDDPGELAETDTLDEALRAIQENDAVFVSRGDRSGTHIRELQLWDAAGIDVTTGDWYQEAGQGMGMILVQVSERGAYTLTDTGTFRSMADRLNLRIHVPGPVGEGYDRLRNQYGIMAVNPAVHPHVAYDRAMTYIEFVTGPTGREIIEGHTVEGEPLFLASSEEEQEAA